MFVRNFVFSMVMLSSCISSAQVAYPPDFDGAEAVVYKQVGDVQLKMWIFSPEGHNAITDSRPAIVFFFGGGWKAGNPSQFERHCRYLASRGMVAATADYRVLSRHNVQANACVEDCKSAVRWLRQNAADLGIDKSRIAAAGGSAGGHTACCTALIEGLDSASEDLSVSSAPNALALFNPAVMIAPLAGFSIEGFDQEKFADIASRTGIPPEQICPIHHVRSGMPPAIIFHGIADTTVPYATVEEFSRRMANAGNRCELNGFPEAPHGFFNESRGKDEQRKDRSEQWCKRTILKLDLFLQSLGWLEGDATVHVVDSDNVAVRGDFSNSFHKFAAEKKGHVAFLGGSITEMDGYRPRVTAWLQQRFPETAFKFTNAGIASTCSNTGAFRFQRDVLSGGDVDLLFVEFAVNDDQDAFHTPDGCIQGMEGIVRHALTENPNMDIVMTHFVNPGMLETLNAGKTIVSATQHERVAQHYGISSVYLSKEVADRINAGTLTWQDFGGTHPGPIGNQLAADLATSVLDAGWQGLSAKDVAPVAHDLPAKLLLPTSFAHGTLLPLENAKIGNGFNLSVPAWQSIEGSKRERFLNVPILHAEQAGSKLQLEFSGTAVGVFVVAGPDAGQLTYEIDGGESQTAELFHRYSEGLHYPRTVMLARDLPAGRHVLTVTVAETHHETSKGHSARILGFAVNEAVK
ncbi:MAG: alpha/beta hydrolase fold domain-containing protein [Fuerstiella sp.]